MRATALALLTLTVTLLWAGFCPAQTPVVVSHTPGSNELNVEIDREIHVFFNVDMLVSTFGTVNFIVRGSYRGIYTGLFAYAPISHSVIFTPDDSFLHGEEITVTLTDGILSVPGYPLVPYSWSFTAEAGCGVSRKFGLKEIIEDDLDPNKVLSADLNNDGWVDLVTHNPDNWEFVIQFNDGTGSFMTPGPDYPNALRIGDICPIDFSNDGDIDIAFTDTAYDAVWILINNGDGTFQYHLNYFDVGNDPNSICSADLNNDGHTDLVVANDIADNISVLLNNDGFGFFAQTTYGVGNEPKDVCSADFNNDGFFDIVTADYFDGTVNVLLNDSDGTFDYSNLAYNVGYSPGSVFPADLDNDGFLDIVTSSWINHNVSILLNDGDGTFDGGFIAYDVGDIPWKVISADLNNDGYSDVASVNGADDNISILLNSADNSGTLVTPPLDYWVGDIPVDMCFADFDNDGDLDLATANRGGNNLTILTNWTTAVSDVLPPPESLNEPINQNIYVSFDVDIHVPSIGPNTFVVNGSIGGLYPGTYAYAPLTNRILFAANDHFQYGELITVTLTDGLAIECGNPINPYIWSFTIKAEDGSSIYHSPVEIPISYSGSPSGTNHICAGDFNNDGLADLAAVCTYANVVAILIQDAANPGTFLAPQFTPVHGGWIPGLCAAELNGDEYTDLVTLEIRNYSPDERSANFLINQGPPNYFTDIQRLVIGSGPSNRIEPGQVEPADFDGDGDLDLVVTDTYSDLIDDMLILYNPGDGISYEIDSLYSADGQNDICIADFDKDGDQDLAAHLFYGNGSVFIYFNEGGRVFDRFEYPAGLAGPRSLCAGDLNRDGLPDIAVVNNPNGGINSIKILLNDEADPGHAFNISTYNLGEHWSQHPYDIWTSDLNENGYLDLAIGFSLASQIAVLLNNADETGPAGTFYTDTHDFRYQLYSTGDNFAADICLADFTGEGSIDIATLGTDCITLLTNPSKIMATAYVGGFVFGPTLVPIPGVYVEIRTPGPPLSFDGNLPQYNSTPGSGGWLLDAIDSCFTDEDGYFEFYVPSGTYDLWLSHESFNDTLITGIVAVVGDSTIVPDIPMSPSGCGYVTGDANGSGSYNGLDITYGVSFFKGGNEPVCDTCLLCPDWFYCGDVNGSCNYNGLDVTYGVNFLKGIGPDPAACGDCPPVGGIAGRPGGKSEYNSTVYPAGAAKGANLKMKR